MFRLFALFIALITPALAIAHEFWIEPEEYQVDKGQAITAHFRNGEGFKGVSLGYFSRQSRRFDLAQDGTALPIAARMGDVPALTSLPAPAPGLAAILHETAPSTISYKTWEKFAKFAAHKDFPDIRARHLARGLPEAGFTETYFRFAKALIAVGNGAGHDRAWGMETEFVALTNPYADALPFVDVQILYQGAPRADVQIEVFERSPLGPVTVTLTRSDAAGKARIPVKPGHEYLLDAVVLRPAPAGGEPVWETLWAALTFAVPR